jgi:hypothetical protein
MKSRITLLFAAAVLSACSGYGVSVAKNPPVHAFAPPPDQHATVCVFRPHSIGASVVTPVTDNGRLVGATEGQSYFCYLAEPGQHLVRVDDARPAELDVVAGEHYYLRHDFKRGPDTLEVVDKPVARALAKQALYTVLDEAPEGLRAPPAIALARARGSETVGSTTTTVTNQEQPTAKTRAAKASAPTR